MGPFAAAFMNRFGVRRMMLVSLAIIVVGLLLSMGMTRLWQLVMMWGVVIGNGTGLTAMVLGATVATRWFTHRRRTEEHTSELQSLKRTPNAVFCLKKKTRNSTVQICIFKSCNRRVLMIFTE